MIIKSVKFSQNTLFTYKFFFARKTIYTVFSLRNITENVYIDVHFLKILIIPVLQVVSVHPDVHPKHVPFCMRQTLSLQFVGHRCLQSFPYTPEVSQPKQKVKLGM